MPSVLEAAPTNRVQQHLAEPVAQVAQPTPPEPTLAPAPTPEIVIPPQASLYDPESTPITPVGANVWLAWNTSYAATGSTTVRISSNTASGSIWGIWNDEWYGSLSIDTGSSTSAGTIITVTNNDVWGAWNSTWVQPMSGSTGGISYYRAKPEPETAEQRASRIIREQAWKEQVAKEEAERKIAEQKARQLLLEHLSAEQRKEFERDRKFHVTSQMGHVYLIEFGWSRNVRRLDKKGGRVLENYCIHPNIHTPVEDNLLVQKLMLECSEELFIKTANRS